MRHCLTYSLAHAEKHGIKLTLAYYTVQLVTRASTLCGIASYVCSCVCAQSDTTLSVDHDTRAHGRPPEASDTGQRAIIEIDAEQSKVHNHMCPWTHDDAATPAITSAHPLSCSVHLGAHCEHVPLT